MKTTRIPNLLSLCTIFLCLLTTGCSSNDEPDDATNSEYIRACYSVKLAQSWYDLYDVVVTYTDVKGDTKSITITADYDYDEHITSNNASKIYSLSVTAKPKDKAPEIDQNASYNLDKSCMVNIYKYTSQAAMQALHTVGNSVSLSTAGNDLQTQLSEELIIFYTSYSLSE